MELIFIMPLVAVIIVAGIIMIKREEMILILGATSIIGFFTGEWYISVILIGILIAMAIKGLRENIKNNPVEWASSPQSKYQILRSKGYSDIGALDYLTQGLPSYTPIRVYINEWKNTNGAIMIVDKSDERKREHLKDYRAEKVAKLKELEEKINIERKKYNL